MPKRRLEMRILLYPRFMVAGGLMTLLLVLSVCTVQAQQSRLFELRIYTAHDGKLGELNKRFREHTSALFVKHGMTLIGYWTPSEGAEAENTLIYILAYPNMGVREKSWQDFRDDPEWQRAARESRRNGRLVEKVENKFLNATDYSPIQ